MCERDVPEDKRMTRYALRMYDVAIAVQQLSPNKERVAAHKIQIDHNRKAVMRKQ